MATSVGTRLGKSFGESFAKTFIQTVEQYLREQTNRVKTDQRLQPSEFKQILQELGNNLGDKISKRLAQNLQQALGSADELQPGDLEPDALKQNIQNFIKEAVDADQIKQNLAQEFAKSSQQTLDTLVAEVGQKLTQEFAKESEKLSSFQQKLDTMETSVDEIKKLVSASRTLSPPVLPPPSTSTLLKF